MRVTEKVVILLDQIAGELSSVEFKDEEIGADEAQELIAKAGFVTALLGQTIADLLKVGGDFSLGENASFPVGS